MRIRLALIQCMHTAQQTAHTTLSLQHSLSSVMCSSARVQDVLLFPKQNCVNKKWKGPNPYFWRHILFGLFGWLPWWWLLYSGPRAAHFANFSAPAGQAWFIEVRVQSVRVNQAYFPCHSGIGEQTWVKQRVLRWCFMHSLQTRE